LLTLALLIAFSSAYAQTKSAALPPLDQLFLDIPEQYLLIPSSEDGKHLSRADRAKLITLVDKKNGYLEATGSDKTDIFAGAQLALFKTKAGGYLIGYHFDSAGDNNTHLQMLTKDGDKWTDVTAQVLPKITQEMVDRQMQDKVPEYKKNKKKLSDCASGTYSYKLPRYGRTIELFVESDCYSGPRLVLWTLTFDGTKFNLSK
jgi:hypothetical protein